MVSPRGLIPSRRAENIHGSLKSDEPVSYELPLGWRYAKRSLKIPGTPAVIHFPLAHGKRPLICEPFGSLLYVGYGSSPAK